MKFIGKNELVKDMEKNSESMKMGEVIKKFLKFVELHPKRKLFVEILGEEGGIVYDKAGGNMMTHDTLLRSLDEDLLALLIANIRFRWHEILSLNEMLNLVDNIDFTCDDF